MVSGLEVHGYCDEKYGAVREAFAANFASEGEVGAGFAVVSRGQLVVDLWGGHADPARTRSWTRDTVTNVWSTSKGVAAICFAMIVDRGKASYDDPVGRFWPEFAVAGKDTITIAQLLSHQGGLCGFAVPVTMRDIADQDKAERLIAAQAPFWQPGTACGYHAVTYGTLTNALFRRIEGRTLAKFLEQELSAPLGLSLTFGLPEERAGMASELIAPPELDSTSANPNTSVAQQAALANPVLQPMDANTAYWRASPMPSVNAFATAPSLARLYGALASGEELEGNRFVSPSTIAEATRLRIDSEDLVLGMRAKWAAGFLLNVHSLYGDSPSAFGHSGWGGSLAFADPSRGLGVAYVMNRMGQNLIGDRRGLALIGATLRSADSEMSLVS
jgi:CubicO group peptidase (beta-lactamase class C family)